MRKLFVSYARENRPDVDQLVEHLGMMGYDTWVDVSLRGGQDWWEEILHRIADTDVFIAVVSEATLNSTACRREFDWAESLSKPVLPVAIEPLPSALPRRISKRQVIDYFPAAQRDKGALKLQGGLGNLPPPPPLPNPLPDAPEAPLSYLTDLVDLVTQVSDIEHAVQHQILVQIEPALRAADPEERRGGRDILDRLSRRHDLYADVDWTITRLKDLSSRPAPVGNGPSATDTAADTGAGGPSAVTDDAAPTSDRVPTVTIPTEHPEKPDDKSGRPQARQSVVENATQRPAASLDRNGRRRNMRRFDRPLATNLRHPTNRKEPCRSRPTRRGYTVLRPLSSTYFHQRSSLRLPFS